ncbi:MULTISPECIES: DUF4124 domain-containing protein [Pseudoxanthomonas]|jgi:hypothetical protein|uniref:DUF4124 domain-containing protein n=1 Tax=Pseudoxanthomonas TaxID=83618 RepID=UPI000DB21AA1|nr:MULTISPECIES: DUF4124 domain-containing protein [Pseudoxanthomonas]MCR6626444.1 DUF4124 domain-containing protein [Pseudoxanthomonas sp.]NCT70685.1 DUF4124 domain-containing protein [Xanthomonadaceae bacterium]PZQ32884.1 MAG: DUF4124 domain-containing protein [Stenotrophomonas acidaminiphila]
MRLLSCLAVLALCLATAATVQAQQVYQWKDKNGVTHYSDSPPPNQTVQNRRINQYGAAAAEVAQPAGKPVDNPQCASARANLQILGATKGPIQQDTDGDGKPDTVLDDTGRENQRNLAEAAVKAYCTSAGT